ncbi:MAG: TVP38/TMEM64 family protein [Rhodobacteraceae bacterium]|nr:TVP38/TMEM64 family protein [Paracoccaceae bacterium]
MTERRGAGPELSLRRALPLLALGLAALAALWLWGDVLRFETLRDNRAELLAWRDGHLALAAAAFLAAYVTVVALSLPGAAVMTLAGGFLFDVAGGTALAVLGATLGATAVFLAARHGFGAALHARLRARGGDGALPRIERGIAENAVSYLLLMRLMPVVPFFVANLAPAFLGVGTRLYVLTTFFGIIPGTFVYAWIGAGLGAVFARGGQPDLGLLSDPVVLGPLLALSALATLPLVLKRWRGRKARR